MCNSALVNWTIGRDSWFGTVVRAIAATKLQLFVCYELGCNSMWSGTRTRVLRVEATCSSLTLWYSSIVHCSMAHNAEVHSVNL